MKTKICTKCGKKLPATAEYFYRDKSKKDGLEYQCKQCYKKYYQEHREQIAEYQQEHREQIAEQKRKYRQEHCEQIAEYRQEYNNTIVGHLRNVFGNAKRRCNNPKNKQYKNYGGRGIKCLFVSSDEFVNYIVNELQIDPRGLTIDRINNDGNYEPGNIRFVTLAENNRNKR